MNKLALFIVLLGSLLLAFTAPIQSNLRKSQGTEILLQDELPAFKFTESNDDSHILATISSYGDNGEYDIKEHSGRMLISSYAGAYGNGKENGESDGIGYGRMLAYDGGETGY